MSDPELSAYARQIVLPEVGVHGQRLLADSSVLIVGLGGLGCPAALYLAGAGIGRLLLMDPDRVARSNLHRQVLYGVADVGRGKAVAAQDRLRALRPDLHIEALASDVRAAEARASIAAADVVLDCTDNFPARFALNAACVAARRPLISGAAIRFIGQLGVFDLRDATGPCYACLYPDAGEAAEVCEDSGVLGPVAGIIGSLQALAALKLLLGLEAGVGRLQQWDANTLHWRSSVLHKDPGCRVCGRGQA